MQQYGLARFGGGSKSSLTAANNYGRRLIKGQIKRAHNLAKQSGRSVKIANNGDSLLSKTTANGFLKDDSMFPYLPRKIQHHVRKGKDIIGIAGANQDVNTAVRKSFIDDPKLLHYNIWGITELDLIFMIFPF